jgi:hypothetical protein
VNWIYNKIFAEFPSYWTRPFVALCALWVREVAPFGSDRLVPPPWWRNHFGAVHVWVPILRDISPVYVRRKSRIQEHLDYADATPDSPVFGLKPDRTCVAAQSSDWLSWHKVAVIHWHGGGRSGAVAARI